MAEQTSKTRKRKQQTPLAQQICYVSFKTDFRVIRGRQVSCISATLRQPKGRWSLTLDNPSHLGKVAKAMQFRQLRRDNGAVLSVRSDGPRLGEARWRALGLSDAECRFMYLMDLTFHDEPVAVAQVRKLTLTAITKLRKPS